MADTETAETPMPDYGEMTSSMADIALRSQRLVANFLARHASEVASEGLDPFNIGSAFMEMTAKMMADPAKIVEAQVSLWQDYMALWQSTASRMIGHAAETVVEPTKDDRRFRDEAWSEHEVFNYIKQSYLLTSRWLQTTVGGVEGLDEKTRQKVDFYTRQFVNALSPSNFVMTNPEVLRETLETGGENLVNGLNNLLQDLERGDGKLSISMTDYDAFEVGKNIATTPGKVVFRNDLLELIQYAPTTETVHQQPLLMITPWINKYYILDLRPENSFIKWAVDQGHTVFVTSWVNPDEKLAEKTFEDYMLEGAMAALDAVEQATGEDKINVVGYCIGGTLLACAMAYMAEKKDDRIASATFLTTMIDFTEPGELGVFIDDAQLTSLENKMSERGYLEGSEMASTFNMMRDNDLIWSFVVNNYLLGKDPFPFDLLYWNADSTRMPAAMHSFYLRKMYLENKLAEPGGITLGGVDLDLGKVTVPIYILSTREDHIAPWKSTFAATRLFSGPKRFVLAASGHIAGVVNSPERKKYGYWTNPKGTGDPDAWFANAEQHDGSWWPEWDSWLQNFGGEKVPARVPGGGPLNAMEDAPGTYVLVKAD